VLEHGAHHAVDVQPSAIGEAFLGHRRVDALEIGGAELLDREAANASHDVLA
jgi:hypothetical protein